MSFIPFNKPYFSGKETEYIKHTIESGKVSGDGPYTKKCQEYFKNKYNFKHCLLSTSCTDALEMAAILADIQPGDEVIAPSYTFVSTVNAFVLRGANIIFADSCQDHPCMNIDHAMSLVTSRTRAIIPVHYAGVACDMDKINKSGNYVVIEDSALAIDSYYKNKPLGSIGEFSTFSFHETKNITSGEGGMLVISDSSFNKRAEVIREKGTNRSAFSRGEIDKYGWIDIGSSFLPSEITAAFLYAQLEILNDIQKKRKELWNHYYHILKPLSEKGFIKLPVIPNYSVNNGHLFYILCDNENSRADLIKHLRKDNIHAVFHYLSLHKSNYYSDRYKGEPLHNSDKFSETLLRLPMFFELTLDDVEKISRSIYMFYKTEYPY